MSKITYTENLNLTQYSEVDEPVFLNDITRDNALIDASYGTVLATAAAAQSAAAQAVATADTASDKVDSVEATLTASIQNVSDTLTADIEAVAADLQTTDDNLSALTDRVTAAEADIELLQPAKISSLENKVNTNAANITQLQNITTGLNDRLTAAEADIDQLQTDVSDLQSCCETVQSTITEIQTEQATQNAAIEQNADDIDALDTRVTNLESEDLIKTQQILNITNDIGDTDYTEYGSSLSEAIKNIGDSVSPSSTLTQRVAALETLCGDDALTTTAQDLTGAVNELDDEVATNTAYIATNAANITTNADDISALETLCGDDTLTTTAQDLTGAINELDAEVATNTADITAVEGRVDAYTFGTAVDITNYPNGSPYTCPSDGYIELYSGATAANQYVRSSIVENGTSIVSATSTFLNGVVMYNNIYVKKGMKIGSGISSGNTDGYVKFRPIS